MSGIGIMNLTPSDQLGKSSPDLTSAFDNGVVNGVAVRTQWSKVEPTKGHYDWAYLDSAKTLSDHTGKKWSLVVTAGVTTPSWVYAAGAYKFPVHEQSGGTGFMPLPWDIKFQAQWFPFIKALFTRYSKSLSYIVMGGFGRRAESFFVDTQEDMDALDAKAKSSGYLDGLEAWAVGAQDVIDVYGDYCKCPFILDLGAPYPTDEGQEALQSVCIYGDEEYNGRFGVKSDGLAENGPPINSIGVTEVLALSDHTTVGYQFSLPEKTDVQGMVTALNRGIGFGAHFIEVYQGDCDYAPHAPALLDAGRRMTG